MHVSEPPASEGPLPGVLKGRDGRVRWGWVVAAFVAVAGLVELGADLALWALDLMPRAPYSLDDPRLFFTSSAHLLSAVVATLLAWRLGQEVGLSRPALLLPGLAAGAALLSLSVGVAALATGAVGLGGCPAWASAGVAQLVAVGPTALAEELWLRGAPLRAAARGLHPALAVAGTGLVFGALHLLNPDATPVAALNVALVGLWFGAMAWRAQSIWPAVGAHLAWNWFEGFVWGQHVSGIKAGCALLTASARGAFFSGGDFGPEASGWTTVLLALACALTVWTTRRPTASATGAGSARLR